MNKLTASNALLMITTGYTVHCLAMKSSFTAAGFIFGFAVGAYVLHLKKE